MSAEYPPLWVFSYKIYITVFVIGIIMHCIFLICNVVSQGLLLLLLLLCSVVKTAFCKTTQN